MSQRIHLGISTCPNDTFAFHALMNGSVDLRGLVFDVELLDVQQLNDRLINGEFDVAKASFHAALMLTDETVVLPSGSALGFGNGPLLLASQKGTSPDQVASTGRQPVVLCPGQTTTATLLYRLFHDQPCEMRQVVFSEIMPALQNGMADFGVCIHEGRFTWQQKGLHCVADLGETWFQQTSEPLPLGGILARRRLETPLIASVQQVILDSIRYGLEHREKTLPTMRKHAAEFDDEVLMAHVDLYVNQHTVDLGTVGNRALQKLSELAKRVNESRQYGTIEVFNATTP